MGSPIDGGGVCCFDVGRTWASEIEVDTASLVVDHTNFYAVVTYDCSMNRVGLFCEMTFWDLYCDIGGDFQCMRLETEVVEAVCRRLLLDYDSPIESRPLDSREGLYQGSMFGYGILVVSISVAWPFVRIETSAFWVIPMVCFAAMAEFLALIGGASGFGFVEPAGLAE